MKTAAIIAVLGLALIALAGPGSLLSSQTRTPTRFSPQEVVRTVRRNRGLAETTVPASDRVERLHRHRGRVSGRTAAKEPLTDDGEFLLDTNRTVVVAQGSEDYPAVAFDGTNYLVAWDADNHGCYDIHCTRVSPSGVVIDTLPIVISDAPGHQWLSGVASDGVNYFVVWTDFRHDPVDGSIYGARVSRDGTVLDSDGIPIWTNSWGDRPAVAFAEGLYFVVWNASGDIYGARVTPGGNVLDPQGIPISTATRSQSCPAVAFTGTDFLVAWQDERSGGRQTDIYAARVSPAGVVRDPDGIPVAVGSSYEESPAVFADGNNWLVVWQDYRHDYWDIYGARVSPAGTVLDPQGIAISTAADDQESPRVSFDGSNYLVVWTGNLGDYTDLYGARVTPSGTVLDTQAIVISAGSYDENWPALAFDGNNFFVVWEDHRRSEEDGDIYGARVTRNGTVLDPQGVILSYGTYEHWWPASAYDGSNYFVVWTDTRNDSDDIYGARVGPDGTVLDPQGIPISTAPHWQDCPAVAFDGTNYLVTWTDFRSNTGYADIYGARVSPAGAVLDPQGIPISTAAHGQYGSAVAFDGTNYLVVWGDGRSGYDDIYAARVSPNGEVLDPGGIPIMTAVNYQHDPAVVFDGTNYFVVWQHYRTGGTYYDIYGARVTPGGTVLDPQGIPIRTAAGSEEVPALAFDGTNFLVVWQEHPGNAITDIYAARVSRNGTVLDPQGIVVCTTAYHKYSPTVAFTGTEFLVVWEDTRHGEDQVDIYGARVSPAGAIIDSGPVVRQRGGQYNPTLLAGGPGRVFLAYQGWTGMIGGRTYNAQRIWGKLNPVPGVAELPQTEGRFAAAGPTIVRGSLNLPAAGNRTGVALLDATGRKVLDLAPGPNDISRLAPGVYFIHSSGDNRQTTMSRVIVTR